MQKKNHFSSAVCRIPFRRILVSCSVIKLCVGFFLSSAFAVVAAENLCLWQDFPARHWQSEYFPVGNGALGAMLNGGIAQDILQLNLDSLWTGDSNLPSGNYDTMGCYQSLGELRISYDKGFPVTPYKRELDIARAIHTVTIGNQTRTTYVSAPDQVLVYTVRSGQPLSGRIVLRDSREGIAYRENGKEKKIRTSYSGKEFRLDGVLPNELKSGKVMKAGFLSKVFVASPSDLRYSLVAGVSADGIVEAAEDALCFRNCRNLVIFLVADTSYELNSATNFRNPEKLSTLRNRLEKAFSAGEETLRQRHIADYRRYFDRVSLSLGPGRGDLPLKRRLAEFRKHGGDPGLSALLFQYGRYLLISSSRPGTLPANLQGIWNNSNTPPWHCDYHTNINLQMNYWGAEPAGLAECHLPLFDLMNAVIPIAEQGMRQLAGKRQLEGFTFRTSLNPFGGGGWKWNCPANAWLALHMFQHYEYNPDPEFLRRVAWPFFEGCMKFWLSYLKERSNGSVVVPRGWSPEHGPVVDGVSYDQQIVTEFFNAFLTTARILKIRNAMTERVSAIRPRLLGPKIGKWGQLQEWEEDRDVKGDSHRHTSHLFAVYPGNSINRIETPEFYRAAEISLAGRSMAGDSRRSWTWPWRAALWARLGNGEKAVEMVNSLLRYNTMDNFFTTHPPFQIDGNLGIVGALCEILLQNDINGISILPLQLPEWPNGSFSGLRAKGGYTIGAAWKDGNITKVEITATHAGPLRVKLRTPLRYKGFSGKSFTISMKAGETAVLVH